MRQLLKKMSENGQKNTHKHLKISFEAKNHGLSVSGTLQFKLPEGNNNGRQHERTARHTVARIFER